MATSVIVVTERKGLSEYFLFGLNSSCLGHIFSNTCQGRKLAIWCKMELFLENHGQNIKKIVIKLIYVQSCTFRHFTKKLYLEEHVRKYIPPHFFVLRKLSSKHYFTMPTTGSAMAKCIFWS